MSDVFDAVLVLTTVPSPDLGEAIGRSLVEAGVAACVNVLPPMVSIYRWKGAVQRDTECQLMIKTVRSQIEAVQTFVSDHHPYDLPEFLVLTVEAGDPAYLAWVAAESSHAAR
jgi:periplasmic divalent cation tolerance protein